MKIDGSCDGYRKFLVNLRAMESNRVNITRAIHACCGNTLMGCFIFRLSKNREIIMCGLVDYDYTRSFSVATKRLFILKFRYK